MAEENKPSEPLMTAEEVGDYLGYTKGTIYQKVSKGDIPFLKLGHTVRFRRTDIDHWIDAQNSRTGDEDRRKTRTERRAQ